MQITFIVFLLLSLNNCNNGGNTEINHYNETNCYFDTNINNIYLEKDLKNILGNIDTMDCEPNRFFYCYNNDLSEELKLIFYPGRKKNHASYFIVKKNIKTYEKESKLILNDKNFITGSGIKIGDSFEDVKSNINIENMNIQKTENYMTLSYIIEKDLDCSNLLNKFNMPYYKANFFFNNDTLIEYQFGFLYP